MDCYKQLCMEISGFKKIICSYSKKSSAAHILPELETALSVKDKEAILYGLDVIIEWYNNNISEIRSNQFVTNLAEHTRTHILLKKIKENLQDYVFEVDEVNDVMKEDDSPIIFLSHKSDDCKYGNALERFIIGLGVKNDQLIYSSHPLHKIPLDANIYEYLRSNIHRNIFMIILWSDKYLESPACLNEMGAAWVVQCDYTNIYVPSFSFGNPKYHECAVDTRKMGAVLNGDAYCKQNMLELKDKIQELFSLENDEKQITYLLDTFIEEIKGV